MPSMPADLSRRVAGSYLQPLLEAAAARGVTAAALERAAGMTAGALQPLPDTLHADDYVRLLDIGAELAADPHFGLHVGERVKLGTYSVYGLILLSCRDFGQAFEQTMRYEQLAHDLGRSTLTVADGVAHYTWHSNYGPAQRHLADSVFAGIRVFGNWLAGITLPAAQLALMHDGGAAEARDEYVRVLGAMPSFGAPANVASFDAALLAFPVPNADVSLYPVLQQHAEQLLRQRAQTDNSIAQQVHAAIVRNLAHGQVRLASIAEELKLSPRTLQRKLSEAGATFQQILDQARFALAKDYLRQPELGLVDIAFLLGYQEQSAFNHAFKEWAGVNPGAYRS
ncbi:MULTISPECIES: AraC family transcriptional regulator [unclassified Duganella]|uniref:AraC family transcriptional regulator n=1 Tax=unclassified Duganella TaxID=2636909 RepID=UPI000E351E1B|nr:MULTISPECIES: AraC family transcriptional regulator [unclassified Duganella]RFP18559.1 AraC family transcriptional regulator [Duganella sp. BJB475]RFP35224.1 AraC family transcriptional regulator [Duganella sp. BJB476]